MSTSRKSTGRTPCIHPLTDCVSVPHLLPCTYIPFLSIKRELLLVALDEGSHKHIDIHLSVDEAVAFIKGLHVRKSLMVMHVRGGKFIIGGRYAWMDTSSSTNVKG